MPTLPVGQYPFVNVFKQFGVGQWKRCCKEGDVTPVMVTVIHCILVHVDVILLDILTL